MDVLRQLKEQVEHVLAQYPETRNSDKLLEVIILQMFYGVNMITDLLNYNTPNMESIRRTRQKIQAEGKYRANSHTQHARKLMEETYLEFAITRE